MGPGGEEQVGPWQDGLIRCLAAALCVTLPAVVCWAILSRVGSAEPPESAVFTPNPAKLSYSDPVSNGLMLLSPRMVWRAEVWKPFFYTACVCWVLGSQLFRGRFNRLSWLTDSSLLVGVALAWPWWRALITPLLTS